MQIHPDKAGYFRDKVNNKKRRETERKLLNVDPAAIEKRLDSAGAIETFRGNVITRYYGEVNLDLLFSYFDIDGSEVRVGSSGAFCRFREMHDDDGSTVLHIVETKVYDVQLPLFGAVSGASNPTPLAMSHFDIGYVLSREEFVRLETFYRMGGGRLRDLEKKRRLVSILPGVGGLEFALDNIEGPVIVEPFLEVEGESLEAYLYGVERLGFRYTDLKNVSAKELIKKKLEEIEQKSGPDQI